MRQLIFILLFSVLSGVTLQAQVPSSCFEIESILVDACTFGNSCGDEDDPACECEGKNEMVLLQIGPDDLMSNDMEVDWANGSNDWQGLCQDAGTAAIVEELNESILNCGLLLEPSAGILPAEAKVIMVTSTDMCVAANSFAGLSDTLYIIFQCEGNYFGHFANYNNTGNDLRTLEIDFGAACADVVTYDRSMLVDADGFNVAQDGARVDFTWNGDDSYINEGCNAPVEQALFDAGSNVSLCPGQSVQLEPEYSGVYTDLVWSGGAGSFDDPLDPFATYTLSEDDADEFTLTLTATGCNGPITDEVQVFNTPLPLTGLTSSLGDTICEGQSTTLTPEGSLLLYEWEGGILASDLDVSEAGVYEVTGTNVCGTYTADIQIWIEEAPSLSIVEEGPLTLCTGDELTLNLSAESDLGTWSTGLTAMQITVDEPDIYTVSVTSACGEVSDNIEVLGLDAPEASISPAGPYLICDGESVNLQAEGVDLETTVLWSTGEMGDDIDVAEAGPVTVVLGNICGADSATVEIEDGGASPVASIAYDDDLLICPGEEILLTASGGEVLSWNGSLATGDFTVTEPGEYTVIVTNICGSDDESVSVFADEAPEATLSEDEFAICNGELAQVMVFGTGTITWSDGAIGASTGITEPGDYYVIAQAACGQDTAYFTVVEEDIIAMASGEPLLGEAPLTVEFSDETQGEHTSLWAFPDGLSQTGEAVTFTFVEDGIQEVILTVSSPLGCESEASVFVDVGACPFALFVPAAFTPDGDGINDILRIEGNCIEEVDWRIYDRWGREVYFSEDPNELWNGAEPSGYAIGNSIYSYQLRVRDSNGVYHDFQGHITAIR